MSILENKYATADRENYEAKHAAGVTWEQISARLHQKIADCAEREPEWEATKVAAGITLDQISDRLARKDSGYVKQHQESRTNEHTYEAEI